MDTEGPTVTLTEIVRPHQFLVFGLMAVEGRQQAKIKSEIKKNFVE